MGYLLEEIEKKLPKDTMDMKQYGDLDRIVDCAYRMGIDSVLKAYKVFGSMTEVEKNIK